MSNTTNKKIIDKIENILSGNKNINKNFYSNICFQIISQFEYLNDYYEFEFLNNDYLQFLIIYPVDKCFQINLQSLIDIKQNFEKTINKIYFEYNQKDIKLIFELKLEEIKEENLKSKRKLY